MGNQTSSEGETKNGVNQAQQALRKILQPNNNGLGISRGELDERCRPSGLYASCNWDEKAIRRLIGDGKLAARLKGSEDPKQSECPICFFTYSEINVTSCCHANICTECFLQVKPQKMSSKTKNGKTTQHNCPFCNAVRFQVSIAKADPEQAIPVSLSDDHKLENQTTPLTDGTITPPQPSVSPKMNTPPTSGFGSHLEKNERVALMRARSSSLSESHQMHQSPVHEISSLAMTPEERHTLEQEMRAQHHHPLAMRLEQEEDERRMRNEMEYYRQRMANPTAHQRRTIADVRRSSQQQQDILGGQRLLPPRIGRDWSRVVDSLGRNSDLVVMEAAFMLSMEQEEARRRSGADALNNLDDRLTRLRVLQGGLSEEQQMAIAIAASLRESELNNTDETAAIEHAP